MSIGLEVCTAGVADSRRAAELGADRLELCAALELGGLTPSAGVLAETRAAVRIPVIAMIRPRPGDFRYSEAEWQALLADATAAVTAGVAGLAFGVLTDDGRIDAKRTAEFVRRFGAVETVFHRAFDLTPNPREALQTLCDLGVTRVLTAGGRLGAAWENRAALAELQRAFGARIQILPGGGVRAANAKQLASAVGANWVHASCARVRETTDPFAPHGALRLDESDLVALRRQLS